MIPRLKEEYNKKIIGDLQKKFSLKKKSRMLTEHLQLLERICRGGQCLDAGEISLGFEEPGDGAFLKRGK